MAYRKTVGMWLDQGIINGFSPYYITAKEMMHLAFSERNIQPNPFMCTIRDSQLMDHIRMKFENTLDTHLEILARPEVQRIEGRGIGSDYFVYQLGSALSEFNRLTDESNYIVLAIFCCRYGVYHHLQGVASAADTAFAVISGMASTAKFDSLVRD